MTLSSWEQKRGYISVFVPKIEVNVGQCFFFYQCSFKYIFYCSAEERKFGKTREKVNEQCKK